MNPALIAQRRHSTRPPPTTVKHLYKCCHMGHPRPAIHAGPTKHHPSRLDAVKLAAAYQTIQQVNRLLVTADGPPPTRIVLLSDGRKNVGREVDGPALECKNAGISIGTISLAPRTNQSPSTSRGKQVPVPAAPETMQRIAQISGGHWYDAPSTDALRDIYRAIGSQVGYETQRVDASKPWMVLGTIISVAGASFAPRLDQRVPIARPRLTPLLWTKVVMALHRRPARRPCPARSAR